jgi:hypothetical protein
MALTEEKLRLLRLTWPEGLPALSWEQREEMCGVLRRTRVRQTTGAFVRYLPATESAPHWLRYTYCALGAYAQARFGGGQRLMLMDTMLAARRLGLPERIRDFVVCCNDQCGFTFAEIAAAIELCVPVLPPVGTGGPEERVIEERIPEEEYEARMEAPLGVGAAETAACAEAEAT